ncbi:Short-chain dehydrogenase [Sphingomonas aurantiaca]|uniref:Short-chain dehydrogenase n=1 Tax=Sphingomonas aurantiaca TaxID=185949 RepID=A0A5E8AKN0_9SPHN|nr:SDR family oxidoreductase [Sphingomonas aurantiaca]VVT31464.1 Short-chain dehydrogenase [Sphingomonas aurantiaca]
MTTETGDRLAGRVAIVTGGGRGLGRAMVLGLAAEGARVIAIAARQKDEVEAVAREAALGRVLPMTADVTREEDCARVVATATERFGQLDILVNNAGRGMKYVSDRFLTEPTHFWKTDPAVWRMVIDTNVNGPFLMARAAAGPMIAAGWGRIVNITMNHATMRRRGFSPYGPSKAALESETIIWSHDLEGTGVTVNALLPGGATATGMIPEALPQEARKDLLDPTIIVPPLLWLSSDGSDGVTGCRLDASRWSRDLLEAEAARMAMHEAGWASP